MIVYYSVYKTRLDLILIKKMLNNYMVLSEAACRNKSVEEISGYYKRRLYHYIHRYQPEYFGFIRKTKSRSL